ncbi:hypothetical protein [Actinoplanes sp. HUAS TT8]|uniref:WXG100 family type VII secretion target n=1 Tax=Actinoplanes sp. HUAS TT8 TaxID=3447453 RepID=UPI003F51D71F
MADPSSSPPPLVSTGPNGIYASGETGSEGNVYDYTDKDWKWIEAVLTGSSAVNNANGAATAAQNAAALVNPQSLRDAGNIFNNTQSVMRGVAQNLASQIKGLAGDGRAWQGTAAETFKAKMLDVANYLERQAERINGGDGELGVSVPNQLFHSGNMLEWAQKQVLYIDHFYAGWASNYVKDYGDGVVHVSEVDGLPEIMTNAMREVMGKLVTEYVRLGTSAVNTPQPMNPETGSPTGGSSTPPPNSSLPSNSVPSYSPPPFESSSLPPTPSISSSAPPELSSTPPPSSVPTPSASATPTPTPPALSTDAPDEVTGGPDAPDPSATDVPPPDAPDATMSAMATPDDVPDPTDIPDSGAADTPDPPGASGADPPAFSAAGGDGGGLPGFDQTGDGTGTGANTPIPPFTSGNSPSGGTNGGKGAANVPVPEFDGGADAPGGGAGGGSGGSAPGFDASGNAPGADGGASDGVKPVIPPLTSVDAPIDTGAGGSSGTGTGTGAGSPPMMPPMSPPQSGTSATDRSDSSGLVGGDAADWDPGSVPGAPEASGGAAPGAGGGTGLETPGGVTTPSIPGVDTSSPGSGSGIGTGTGAQTPVLPPMSPPQSGTGATDRPDSSGLVGGDAEDWDAGPVPGAPEASGGAAPGAGGAGGGGAGVAVPGAVGGGVGSGVDGVTGPGIPSVESPGTGSGTGLGPGAQTPMLPPMSPPQSATGATDRPDSSGLVGGDAEDWDAGPVPGAPEASGGAAPGAGGGGGVSSGFGGVTSPSIPPLESAETSTGTGSGSGLGSGASGAGMPMMPQMSPPQSQRGAADRSDSSALVAGDDVVWDEDQGAGTPDAPDGAERGRAAGGADYVPPTLPLGGLPSVPLIVGFGESGQRRGSRRDQAPLAAPPLLPAERRRAEERSEAGELLDEDEGAWVSADEEIRPDQIAVVRESEDDFGSWDSEPLPWETEDVEGEDDPSSWGGPEPVESSPPPPPAEEEPKARPRPSGQSYESVLLAEMPLRSGGPDLTPEDRSRLAAERAERVRRTRIEMGLDRDDDAEEEEPAERRAADLLDRDDTQWGNRDDAVDGVIG